MALLAVFAPAERANAGETCLESPYQAEPGAPGAAITALLDMLMPAFRQYPQLRDALIARAPRLCLDDAVMEARGFFDMDGNIVVLGADLGIGEQAAILLHELRHVDQVTRGICPGVALSMQEHARAVQAMEADANVVAVVLSWALREAGEPAAWQAVTGWPQYSDIADVFQSELERGASLAQASSAAFTQWYASDWRRESYYIASCSDYLDRLDRTHAQPRYEMLPREFLDGLCTLPDGTGYPCAAPEGAPRP